MGLKHNGRMWAGGNVRIKGFDRKFNRKGKFGTCSSLLEDSYLSRQSPVVDSCEYNNPLSGFTKGATFFD
jgi:hypothetical protein